MTIISLLALLVLWVANFSQGKKDICHQPILPGPCRAHIRVWGFNSTKARCVPFIYGGCMGNKNNFDTREECKRACVKKSRKKRN